MSMLHRSPKRVIKRLQLIVSDPRGLAGFGPALQLVLDGEYWRKFASPQGILFQSFPEFLSSPQPYGLGVDTTTKLQPFLDVLKADRHYALYAEVIASVRRRPGAQRTNIADSDICRRFYTPSTSTTSLDQLLPRLQERPELFARVCSGQLTPHAAIREVMQIERNARHPSNARLRFGVVNLQRLSELKASAKLKCACAIFDALDDDTRCGLIARRLEQRLGTGLAERWRKPHAHESQ
jgi:hypothetical protein